MVAGLKSGGVILEGDFTYANVNYHNPILTKAQYNDNGDMWGLGITYSNSQEHSIIFQYRIAQGNKQFAVSSYKWLDFQNVGSLNGKNIPDYPNDNVNTYTLKLVAGTLTWVQDA